MDDLFTAAARTQAPLADRMRPRSLDEFVGQSHIVGPGKLLRRAIEADRLTSSIFWGPPGCGKTTLASIIAETTRAAFVKLNAVTSGVGDVREVLKEAEERLKLYGQSTYLLLDECHRWSKAQSDSILPAIERGVIRFIGSTTENPMIAMTPAIVSRCRLFHFEKLSDSDVTAALNAAIKDHERGYGAQDVRVDEDALRHIVSVANGDARSALNALELAVLTTPMEADGSLHVTLAVAEESIQSRVMQMDESLFYDMLSAFCKSLRGSDSDAALAWFARMNRAGVDPRIVVRRVIAHASEDVGLANPMAMLQAVAAMQRGEQPAQPEAPRQEAEPEPPTVPDFVPYVDDVPAPEPDADGGDDEDEDEYIPSAWEKRIDALTPKQWRTWQIVGGAAVGLVALASLFVFGEELSAYGLIVAALLALLLPRYLERAWRRKLTTARYAMAAAMLVGLAVMAVVMLTRGGITK